MEHSLLNAFLHFDSRVPRAIRFLLIIAVLLGELAISAGFSLLFDNSPFKYDDFALAKLIISYAFITAALLIFVKLIFGGLFHGVDLHDKFTRKQIESKEQKALFLNKFGLIIVTICIIASFAGILAGLSTFNQIIMNKWITTYCATLIVEFGVFGVLNFILKVLLGMWVRNLVKGTFINTAIGSCFSVLIDWIIYCS